MASLRAFDVLACAAVIALGAPAGAQPSGAVVGGDQLAPFWQNSRTRRVDVFCLGDSNQLHRAAGWDDAVAFVLDGEFGLYGSGLHALGENEGQGAGVGLGSGTLNTAGTPGVAYAGAPAFAAAFLDTETSDLAPQNYLFAPEGAGPGVACGLTLSAQSPLNISGALRFHVTFATFDGPGPGSFSPAVRIETAPPQQLAALSSVSTRGVDGVGSVSLDLPAGTRAAQLSLRLTSGAGIVGPFVGYYASVENTQRTKGCAVHTLYGKGGQSARDMAFALASASDQTLSLFLNTAVSRQGGPPVALVRVCSGLNDRSEPLASVGTEPQTPGSAPTAHADNLGAIITRIQQIWVLNGYDIHNIYFELITSHPVPGDGDAPLALYRAAAEDVAKNHPRTASVDLSRLAPRAEIEKNDWYVTQGDYNHLRLDGMRVLARRELDALLEAAKP